MLMYPELDNLSMPDLVKRFFGSRPDEEEDGDGVIYYTELALRLIKYTPEGLQFLLDSANNCNLGQLRSILVAISYPPCINDLRIDHLVESCLDHPQPIIIAEAIDALACRNKADLIHRVLSLYSHPCEYVRGSVLRFMCKLYPQQALSLLLDALHDPHYIVRESAIDELDDLGDVSAIPAIEPLLSDPEEDVRKAAVTAIENLTDRLHHPEDYLED